MLHVRFVRPWWDSTAWTVEYSRIQFMHWYSWRDITPWHFSAVRLVGEGHRHHRSIYKECVNAPCFQSALNSIVSTHGVCTKQVVTWCDFVLFCYLIIPKQRGFTQKNGVLKKKNSGNWHHLVKLFMFWYLHPVKTCKLVPISLNHVRLGAKEVPRRVYPEVPRRVYQASRNMVWLCIVLLFDHSQTTRFHTKKWCVEKKKQWKLTPPCQAFHVLVPAPSQNM